VDSARDEKPSTYNTDGIFYSKKRDKKALGIRRRRNGSENGLLINNSGCVIGEDGKKVVSEIHWV
jgi:hypothetical protein